MFGPPLLPRRRVLEDGEEREKERNKVRGLLRRTFTPWNKDKKEVG